MRFNVASILTCNKQDPIYLHYDVLSLLYIIPFVFYSFQNLKSNCKTSLKQNSIKINVLICLVSTTIILFNKNNL